MASSTYIKARTRLRIHFSRFSRSALSYSLCVLSMYNYLLANLACFCKHRNKQIHTHTRHLQRNPKILISRYLLISRYFCVSLPVLLLIRLIAMFFIWLRFGRLRNFLSLFRRKFCLIFFRVLQRCAVFCRSRALFAIFNASMLNSSWESVNFNWDSKVSWLDGRLKMVQ